MIKPPSKQKIEITCKCGKKNIVRRDTINANIKKNGEYLCHHCATIKAGKEGKYTGDKKKRSEKSKKLWKNKEFREKVTQASKKAQSNPEYREKQRQITKKAWENPEYRKTISQKISEHYQKEENREKTSEAIKKLWENQEYREKISQAITEHYKDEQNRTQASQTMKEKWEDPEYRKHIKQQIKQAWENKEFREKMLAIMESQEYREKQSESLKKVWEDEEYVRKAREIRKKNWENPEYREKMAIVRANQPRISGIQKQLYEYLGNLGIKYYEESEKTRIGYYVFDCLVPKQGNMQKHLLIECQGDYWHSSSEAKARDKAKFTYIDRYFPEYEIMYIWEHEFSNKYNVLDRLKNKIGPVEFINFNFDDVTIVGKLLPKDVNSFLDTYHYIGTSRGSKHSFGACLDNKLIAVCVFSSPLRQNTASQFGLESSDVLELSRFCIHPCYHKRNFGSWFISRCLKRVDCRLVVAYADETVGHNGGLYRASNFELHHMVTPDYWYVSNDGFVMHKRTLYGKAVQFGLTEREYAEKFGYVRKYGGRKFCYIRWL